MKYPLIRGIYNEERKNITGSVGFMAGVFILGMMFLLASVVPALIFFTPMVLIYLIITDFILLVVSSMYGLNAIRNATGNGLITGKSAIKNLVMHFVFILDVISAINIYCKIKKTKLT